MAKDGMVMSCPVCGSEHNWKFEGFMQPADGFFKQKWMNSQPVVSCNNCQYMEYMNESETYLDEDDKLPITVPRSNNGN